MEESKEKKEISLSCFLTQRKDLLTTFSVFAALTLFARNLGAGILGEILAVLFLSGFILIWMELWASFPNESGTSRLSHFENVIVFSGIVIVFYWFAKIKHFSNDLFIVYLTLPIVSFVLHFISKFIKKQKIFNKIFKTNNGDKKSLRFVFGFILVFAIFYPTFMAIGWVVNQYDLQINLFFNQILGE